ncbi:unnamed protein product, partial [Didymodactylos carnosus]
MSENHMTDLDEDDVMLLDAWNTIFLWIGKNANKNEKRDAEKIAFDYLKTDPSHRDPDTPIIKTKQGTEPIHFTGFFGYWDREFWNTKSSYETAKTKIHSENHPDIYAELVREKAKTSNINPLTVAKYSYDILTKPVEDLPEDVNPESREVGHLFSRHKNQYVWEKHATNPQ